MSSEVVELSFAETNALRLKLGLKPLEEGVSDVNKEAEDNYRQAREDQAQKAEEDEVRARIEKAKNKRKRNAKLEGKSIAEEEEDDAAASWVAKLRQKQLALKTSQALDEQDNSTTTVRQQPVKKKSGKPEYSAADLKGIRVGHDMDQFEFGDEQILTLKDTGVLEEEDGDELVSISLQDSERLKKNLENKTKKPVYKGYDDDEFENGGAFAEKSILSHYDEEIVGQKKKAFFIAEGGISEVQKRENMAATLRGQAVTLETTKQELRDYYTEEEMAKFKKTKKKKVLRSKKPLSESLGLEPIEDDASSASASRGTDHGSRSTKPRPDVVDDDAAMDATTEPSASASASASSSSGAVLTLPPVASLNAPNTVPTVKLQPLAADANFVDDEDLQETLARARRMAAKKNAASSLLQVAQATREARRRDEQREQDQRGTGEDGRIVLSAVSEFVRNLSEAQAAAAAEVSAAAIPVKKDGDDNHDDDEKMDAVTAAEAPKEDTSSNKWHEVADDTSNNNINSPASPVVSKRGRYSDSEDETITEERPMGKGMAATLAILKSKGIIQATPAAVLEKEKRQREHNQWRQEQKMKAIEKELKHKAEKEVNRSRGKAGSSREAAAAEREREREREREKEKEQREQIKKFDNYKPEINLTYIDQYGRDLTPKQAFRQLSHTFHGKMPGKKKTEKELKKLEDQVFMSKMSSTDTPLGTVAAMMDKQKETGSAFVLLSTGTRGIINAHTGYDAKSGISTANILPQDREKVQFKLDKRKGPAVAKPGNETEGPGTASKQQKN